MKSCSRGKSIVEGGVRIPRERRRQKNVKRTVCCPPAEVTTPHPFFNGNKKGLVLLVLYKVKVCGPEVLGPMNPIWLNHRLEEKDNSDGQSHRAVLRGPKIFRKELAHATRCKISAKAVE